ncbi:MAG: hypothetical protein IJG37_05495 [Synergistaceae bacterium]|nr:hypothetical protein [Synergistaceae bacterium]MBQ7169994.1 hypothetical protein [Synergistaceae bacterium]
MEISPCFPFGKDYQPVSVNRFHDDTLKSIAGSCIDLDSEFFFMASPQTGCVGNLPRENFFRYQPDGALNLGFLMILGYSEKVERAVILSLGLSGPKSGLSAGITACSIWCRGIFEGAAKVIAVAGDDPFFDGTGYLHVLSRVLNDVKGFIGSPGQSYYAEKFGYDRFFMSWENDNPYDIAASRVISEFELDGTREIVGGSSREDFPPFMGASVSLQ